MGEQYLENDPPTEPSLAPEPVVNGKLFTVSALALPTSENPPISMPTKTLFPIFVYRPYEEETVPLETVGVQVPSS